MVANGEWPTSARTRRIRNKAHQEYLENMAKVKKELKDHFGSELEQDDWMIEDFITNEVLFYVGTKVITNLGSCEYCHNYIGPNPDCRRIKNISVLNGCCITSDRAVKPNNTCVYWFPAKFFRQVINKRVERIAKTNPDVSLAIKKADKANYYDY